MLTGDGQANALSGGAEQDWLQGGGGNDSLAGGTGHDSVWGGAGDDALDGGEGDDAIVGNDGIDTVIYATAAGAVTVDLSWLEDQNTYGAGWDTLISIENVIGSTFDDVLVGSAAANALTGGAGSDTLTGGGGADTFIYSALAHSSGAAGDLITDFDRNKDRIDLSLLDADTGASGDQAFHLGATAGHAGDIVLAFDTGSKRTSVSLFVDGDATADAVIYLDGNQQGLAATDFIL